MRSKRPATVAFVIVLIVIVASALAVNYLSSPSASKDDLDQEIAKIIPQDAKVKKSTFAPGSCFDVCSYADYSTDFPIKSSLRSLYNEYKDRLEANGYHVSESRRAFTEQEKAKSNINSDVFIDPDPQLLKLTARRSNGYNVTILFCESTTEESSSLFTCPVPNQVINNVKINISARTR